MKHKTEGKIKIISSGRQILAMAAVYLVAVILVVCFIGYAYCDLHRNNYFTLLQRYSQSFLENGAENLYARDKVYFFNESGEVVSEFGEETFRILKDDPKLTAGKYLPVIFTGKNMSAFKWWVPKQPGHGVATSLVFYGIPVMENGEIRYAEVMVKETPDTLEVATGFIAIITVFFVILVIIMQEHSRRIRKYEEAQKQYIDNVTHELKTPVASVKALAQALSDGKTVEGLDNAFYYGRIMTEADKQEKLISNILELSKIQSGNVNFKIIKVNAEDVFRPVLEKYNGMCNLLDIDFRIGENLRAIKELTCEPAYLSRVLDILLSNAVKYTSKENGFVNIDVQKEKHKYIFTVSDNGIGISAEELPHIFDRFYRAQNARSYSGSGLGLSMAYEIINALGEKIWIKSEEGKGTEVFFTNPV